jgi:hypothetical protein
MRKVNDSSRARKASNNYLTSKPSIIVIEDVDLITGDRSNENREPKATRRLTSPTIARWSLIRPAEAPASQLQ